MLVRDAFADSPLPLGEGPEVRALPVFKSKRANVRAVRKFSTLSVQHPRTAWLLCPAGSIDVQVSNSHNQKRGSEVDKKEVPFL
jgi:hypothetical protein